MSAPDTNVKRQEKNHRPALLGIKGVMIFGAIMLLVIIWFSVMRGDDPSRDTVIGTESEQQQSDGVNVDPVATGTNVSN
ncbi:MAG: hypothetical protein P1U53_10630 [Sulfitobacter sp.]|nr:hypothetical protein [Sulfitobacter sp.]